jgi:hypothetical protein
MITIQKYSIIYNDTVELPIGAKILSVSFQSYDDRCLWAMIDTDQTKKETIRLGIFNTGMEIPQDKNHRFIETTQRENDPGFYFHVFEEIKDK